MEVIAIGGDLCKEEVFSFEEVEEEEEVEVEVILPDISDRSDSVAIMKVSGCTDYDSKNYNPEANNDDGSCIPWVSCSALYLSAYSSPHCIYQLFVLKCQRQSRTHFEASSIFAIVGA